MILKIPAPRLLPMTTAAMAALLLLKCGILVQAAITHGPKPDSGMVTAANAASTDQVREHGKGSNGAPAPAPVKHGAAAQAPASPTAAPETSATPPVAEGPPPVSESERALLQELRQRRKELDARADAVAAREALLAAAEKKLATRVGELQSLQKKLEGLDTAQKQKEDAGWQGLVKVYEAMKPKEAATIFNDLSMPVLLQVLDRMKDAKAAAVMAAMNPDKARDVTAELAQMRIGRDASLTMGMRPQAGG